MNWITSVIMDSDCIYSSDLVNRQLLRQIADGQTAESNREAHYKNGVVGQFGFQKPGFFGKAGLLLVELTHYQKQGENRPRPIRDARGCRRDQPGS